MQAAAGSRIHGSVHNNGIRQISSSMLNCVRMNAVTAASAASRTMISRRARAVKRSEAPPVFTARSFIDR